MPSYFGVGQIVAKFAGVVRARGMDLFHIAIAGFVIVALVAVGRRAHPRRDNIRGKWLLRRSSDPSGNAVQRVWRRSGRSRSGSRMLRRLKRKLQRAARRGGR